MKKFSLLLLFCFLVVAFTACQSEADKMTLLDDITEISIAKSEGYGGVNEEFFAVIDETETVAIFEEVIEGAKQKESAPSDDMPDYDILVRYDDDHTQGFHLLLGIQGEEGTLIYIGHEENGFVVSPEATKELKELINSEG